MLVNYGDATQAAHAWCRYLAVSNSRMPVEKTGALKALGTVVHTAYDGYVTESTFAVDASKPPLCWRTQVAGKGLSGECKGESCISLATAKGQLDAYASGTGVSGDVAGILKALTAAGLGDPDAIREAERKAEQAAYMAAEDY